MWEEEKSKDFLGVGWKFPIQVDEETGQIKTSSYEEDIQEAIQIILKTKKGERAMEPEFGCSIHEYVFSVMDYTTTIQMQQDIMNALVLWEPRITDIQVSIYHQRLAQGIIDIGIQYVVRTTNNPYNLVFPYFMNEGL